MSKDELAFAPPSNSRDVVIVKPPSVSPEYFAVILSADSITAKYSGETDGGLTITTSLELDGGANASSSFDNRSISIASEDMGTITFSGHGGDTVMSGFDDMMPTAVGIISSKPLITVSPP